MRSLQISFLRGWRFFFLLYISILVISFVFEELTVSENTSFIQQNEVLKKSNSILFLPDLEDHSQDIEALIDRLKQEFNFYHIDYSKLEFKDSDYSVDHYAVAINQYIYKHEIDSLIILTEGFGAVIAARAINQNPEKFTSLILYNPEGILELELLGGYHLNKGVYSGSTILSWVLENIIPDFGYFSHSRFNYQVSKTRLDTDLRRAKKSIRNISLPTLIITSENDIVSTLNLATEYNRLITTSSRIKFQENQFSTISNFIESSETVDTSVTVSRKVKSLLPFSSSKVVSAEGWLLTGLMLLIIFSTFISEDLACIGAGLMVARGLMGFFPAVAASFIGIFVGDILIYLSGRWLGKNATQIIPFKWFIDEKDIKRSNHWFKSKGPTIILISRFIPGTRFPTYFTAGVIGASFWIFITYFGIASLIWTPILVSGAMVIGQKLIFYFSIYQEYALLVLTASILLLILILKIIVPLFTYRGRRLLYGKLQRTIHWEFWSPFILYTPIVVYTFYLWIKFKKITVVTAANPGIEEGGFIGESKVSILNRIGVKESVAKYFFIDATNKNIKDALLFMDTNNLGFPIVLKPDIGERGKGVQILKNKEMLYEAFSNLTEPHLMQEYINGKEYGIFYYRYPNEENGHLFSITKKEKICVIGDGNHTLEQLILRDQRAVCMAGIHFDKHIDDLYSIPAKGEKVQLVELGTHSRGALFLDGNEFISSELTKIIDKISKSFEGFYFGRYDIKVQNESDLKSGLNVKVLEINGVTSESTNIYDPKNSYFFAIKTLMKQWRIAFEIGAINYQNGATIPSLSHMVNLILRK